MRYRVSDEVFDTIDDVLDYCISDDYHEEDEYFEEWVNDTEGSICICGDTYYAYDILTEMNSSALDDLRNDYCSEQNDNDRDVAQWALNRADVGDTVDCQYSTIEVIEDEDEYEEDEEDDESKLDVVRQYIEDQRMLSESEEREHKKTENDLMELFQVIKND